MAYTLVRVDNRLVHGQILEAWLPFAGSSSIVVVDDDVASDFFRETVIKMAVPREIDLFVYGVEEFSKLASDEGENDEITNKEAVVLFSSVQSALKSFQFGFRYKKLNIGNLYSDDVALRCAPSIFLSKQDIADIETLTSLGVLVECRCMPKDKPLDALGEVRKHRIVS